MQRITYISIRLVILVVMITLMNIVYTAYFFEKDIQKHSPIINMIRELPDHTDILYIGESSNITCTVQDEDKRAISAMIGDYFPNLVVADITKPASHAGIYKTLLANVQSEVQTVVVTLNLRSFSVEWMNSNLETALQKSMVLIDEGPALWKRMRLSFKDYPVRSEKELFDAVHKAWAQSKLIFPHPFKYRTTLDWKYAIEENTKIDSLTRELSSAFVESYAFQIDLENNERIKDFDEIIALAKSRKWNLVFNLLGENTERAKELCGDELIYLMNQNRDKLVNYFQKKGVVVVDNLHAIKDSLYIDKAWPTEHYAEKGRRIIAENIASNLSQFHKEDYDSTPINSVPDQHFFNDCEGTTKWGMVGELTDEESFSGKLSSITNGDHMYSLSFDHPMASISKNSRESVTVSFMIKGKSYRKVKLVVELRSPDSKGQWKAVALEKLIPANEKWQNCSYSFELDEHVIKKAQTFHTYILNESGKNVFVDDIHIYFK